MSAASTGGNSVDETIECPFCGEPGEVEVDVDESEPGQHVFVQDCAVCCRPWQVSVTVASDGEVSVNVDRS
jgi:hypothetical protein